MRRNINIISGLDWTTIFIYILLVILGWLNIYAAVYNEEHQSIFDFTQRYGKQLVWILLAFMLAVVAIVIEGRFYQLFSYIIYGLVLLLLIGLVLFGKEIHGARSWLTFGHFNLQPSEFAKFATALALSSYISTYNLKINTFKTLFISSGIILLPALLVFMQNDTGSALVFFALVLPLYREGLPGMVLFTGLTAALLFVLTLIMNEVYIISGLILLGFITFLYLSRNIKYTFYGLFLFGIILTLFGMLDYFSIIDAANYYIIFISLSVAMVVYLIFGYLKKITYIYKLLIFIYFAIVFTFTVNYVFNNFLEKHQQQRINILLGIESDPLGIGYNVNQSKIAIGSGGLSGKGFLQGTQTKFNFVPEQSTDFIFCTVGEEWGFIGSLIVIGLFLWLLLRLIILAERQKQQFSRVYGYCVISVFLFHVVINIGMTIGLVPVIGIPLPFFSYGGSSLWAFTLMLFIFLKLDANRLALL